MRAVIFQDVGEVRVEDVAPPAVSEPQDALVRVTVGAICGSDLHIYHGHSPVDRGAVLGHEFVGVVEDVGASVRSVRPGDRVVAAFYTACGQCRLCRRGVMSQCESRAIFGHGTYFGGLGGGQAERCVVPNADLNLVRIPDGVADEQAVFVGDVLATGFFAAERAMIRPGDAVAVVGAGPVGLTAVMCAQLFGPARVFAVDTVEARLELAQELGAVPLNPREVNPEIGIQRRTGGSGADAVLECVGQIAAMETAISMCRGGGTVSSVGVPSQVNAGFPYYDVWNRSITFRSGITNVHPCMRPLLDLIEAGRLRPERVVSHRLPLEEAEEAYRMFDRRQATKVILQP